MDFSLKAYDSEGYSYTMWTYKVVGKNSSWGLHTSDILRVDPSTASYDEILTTWSNLGTSDNFEKMTKFVIMPLDIFLNNGLNS